jgi:hypothetical protein
MERVDLGLCFGRFHPGDPARVAVLLPGRLYPTAGPLFWFAREVAQRRGWSVLEVWDELWDDDADWMAWAKERARAGLAYPTGARRIVVGKSLASAAVDVVTDERLPAVWLTPLLVEPTVAAAFARFSAPTLLVGGTADAAWDGEVARRAEGAEVLEIDGADHSLELPGDLDGSLRLLGEVTNAIDRFLANAA